MIERGKSSIFLFSFSLSKADLAAEWNWVKNEVKEATFWPRRKEDHYLGSIPSGSRILSPTPLGILTDAMGRPAGGKWLSLKYLSRAGIKIPQTQTE